MNKLMGFTLIELLVVVTIIVVLLALLVPAMDKAIYQADLLGCATRQRAVSSSVIQYAFDHKRDYPYRGLADIPPDGRGYRNFMQVVSTLPATLYDIRPPLKGYVASVNGMLQCPFNEPTEMEDVGIDMVVESSYMFYWGWVYLIDNQPERGMFKVGSRFTYQGSGYSLLISDMDLRYPGLPQSSHPDREPRTMQPWIWKEEPAFGTRWNLSRWQRADGNTKRGNLDTNYAYDDGSVIRFTGVKGWDVQDTRMDRVPLEYDNISGGNRIDVPAR